MRALAEQLGEGVFRYQMKKLRAQPRIGGQALQPTSAAGFEAVPTQFSSVTVTGRAKCTTDGRFKVYHPGAGGEYRRSVRAAARHVTDTSP
jgi:hypothetical protein